MASLLSLLRLRSFDTATREGRSRERYRRVALTALTSVAARSVALLSLLISVPLTLPYLGTERYALWMAVSSLLAALASLDLGIGNGLVTAVAESHGRADREAARGYVSSAVFLLLGLAALALLGFAAAYPFLSWRRALFHQGRPAAGTTDGRADSLGRASLSPLGRVEALAFDLESAGHAQVLWAGSMAATSTRGCSRHGAAVFLRAQRVEPVASTFHVDGLPAPPEAAEEDPRLPETTRPRLGTDPAPGIAWPGAGRDELPRPARRWTWAGRPLLQNGARAPFRTTFG